MTAIAIILFVALAYGGVRWFEWSNAFHPSRRMEGDPGQLGIEFEDVVFMTADGKRLHGWWVPHPSARGTILYCHGNAGNISTRLDVITGLHELGVNVFIFDYRGYGRSRGIPGEIGLNHDAQAAYEVVRARYANVEQPPVILYGASLGGSVAVALAASRPVCGLILEGAFTSSIDVGERWFPMLPIHAMARYRFDALSKIMALHIPKLFAHSTSDQVIPFDLGEQLFKAAPEPKRFIPLDGEHGEAGWQETPAFHHELRRFVADIFPAQQ